MTDTAKDPATPAAQGGPAEQDTQDTRLADHGAEPTAPQFVGPVDSEMLRDEPTMPAASAPSSSLPPPPAPRRGVPLLAGMVLGAAVAAGAGYGVQRYIEPQPVFDPSVLESRLTAAEAETQGLRAEVARLSDIAATPPVPDNAVLDRLAAVEARALPDLAPLVSRIDQLEAMLANLANLPSETGVSPAALAALQAEVAALKSQDADVPAEIEAAATAVEARLTEAEARAGELAAQATQIAATASRAAALGQISAALDSGLPFGAALAQLGEGEVPAALSAHADTGLPTIATLRDAFPDAARAALEQALRASTGDTWTDRVTTFLRNQTRARSLTPREGNDPDAILSRAEAAIARADLPAAMTELAALPTDSQTALADWTALAQQRLDAQAALAGLLQAAGQ